MKTRSILCLMLAVILMTVTMLSFRTDVRAEGPGTEESGSTPTEEGGSAASRAGGIRIGSVSISLTPECGAEIMTWSPYPYAVDDNYDYVEDAVEIIVGKCTLADGSPAGDAFLGGENYSIELIISPAEGCYFDDETVIEYDEEDIEVTSTTGGDGSTVISFTIQAKHVNDWDDSYESESETCVSAGYEQFDCAACGTTVRTEKPADPDAHEWGAWHITEEATTLEPGTKARSCELCGLEETTPTVRRYASVYEPDTSWAMSATIAWQADASVFDTAKASVRPATAFVSLDSSLAVYDRDGNKIADDIDSYVRATSGTMIPAFYIKDAATASALKTYLAESGLEDCFVVSTPENKAYVKDVADLLHVRGMLDYSSMTSVDRKTLLDMIASVNGAHGKVVILSSEAATRENILLLQSLCASVWVKTETDTKTIVTHYTNGVNGVLVDDYKAAISAMELFRDDAPTLLRVPLIIGHRGDPSNYVENTLDSAKGAYEEGADSIENDIYLTTDGELYIRHDGDLGIFIGKSDVKGEDLTLAELKALVFNWDDEVFGIRYANEIAWSEDLHPGYGRLFGGKLYGEDEKKAYTVPTMREYLDEFKGKKVVHDTEIKSRNPQVIAAFKELVDEKDAWDQVFTITFEESIMEEIYKNYPEISVGALTGGSPYYEFGYENWAAVVEMEGVEAAVEMLYSYLDQWNATYNPNFFIFSEKTVSAGRHRGLTVWPWTYDIILPDQLAADYLRGLSGLTVDEPWFASDYIEEISSEDVVAKSFEDVSKPEGTAKNGNTKTLTDAEIVELEDLEQDGSKKLVVWRYKADLTIDGQSYGKYYLYSNPFVFTKEEEETCGHNFGEPKYTWSEDNSSVTASRVCSLCGEEEKETVRTTTGITKEPTTSEEGERWYMAQFANPAFVPQTKSVPIDRIIVDSSLYFFAQGDGQEYEKESGKTCDFVIKRSVEDNTAFSHFTGVKIDGKSLAEADYTAQSGSVKLQIKAASMKQLSSGSHTITVSFDDGETEGTFIVTATASGGSKDSGNKKGGGPNTGDDNKPIIWILLLLASGGCAAWLLIRRKQKK